MRLGNISSDDLQLFLSVPQAAFVELEEARQLLLDKKDRILAEDTIKAVWCHLYELPPKEHFVTVLHSISGTEILQEISASENKIQGMLSSVGRFSDELEADDDDLSDDEKESLRKYLQTIFGFTLSVMASIRCLQTFGCYLNDLIAQVRAGGPDADKAMLRAIKIDPTVLGCPSVVQRLSRAAIEADERFFRDVKKALCGQLTKREQANYQKMRLALQILHESGIGHLSPEDLYRLFVEELKLLHGDRDCDTGDVANNLRQFAYQFAKQKTVSQNG